MRLANLIGIDVAYVELVHTANKDVLLIERFDRKKVNNSWQRKSILSALTLLGLDEMFARYASYESFAKEATDIIDYQVNSIQNYWNQVCEEAQLSEVEKNLFWKRQFLNPYAFTDYPA